MDLNRRTILGGGLAGLFGLLSNEAQAGGRRKRKRKNRRGGGQVVLPPVQGGTGIGGTATGGTGIGQGGNASVTSDIDINVISGDDVVCPGDELCEQLNAGECATFVTIFERTDARCPDVVCGCPAGEVCVANICTVEEVA